MMVNAIHYVQKANMHQLKIKYVSNALPTVKSAALLQIIALHVTHLNTCGKTSALLNALTQLYHLIHQPLRNANNVRRHVRHAMGPGLIAHHVSYHLSLPTSLTMSALRYALLHTYPV